MPVDYHPSSLIPSYLVDVQMISAEEITVDDRYLSMNISALDTALPSFAAHTIDTRQHFRLRPRALYDMVQVRSAGTNNKLISTIQQ